MNRVAVEARESYELVLSLAAFSVKRLQIAIDLRSDWHDWVRSRLSAKLITAVSTLDDTDLFYIRDLATLCPVHDAAGYLAWLRDLRTSELYYFAAMIRPDATPNSLGDLTKTRDNVTDLLDMWHNEYFKTVDPSILAGLQDDASEKNQLLLSTEPEEVIESATQGMTLRDSVLRRSVMLVPQYHCRPYSILAGSIEETVIFYPADNLPLWGQNVPVRLPRLARALADPTRVEIIVFLKSGPRRFSEIVKHTRVTKGTVSYHLALLRGAGFLSVLVSAGEELYSIREKAADLTSEAFHQFLKL